MRKKEKKRKKKQIACVYKEKHKQWGIPFAWNMKSLWCLLWVLALSSGQTFPDGFPKVEEKRSSDSKVKEVICTLPEEDERLTQNKPGEVNEENCINGIQKEIYPEERGNTTDIWHAVRLGSLPAVVFWANLDQNNINVKDKNNWTILMSASEHGHLEIVQYLVERGAQVDALDANGQTALMVASSWGHIPVVKYLIEEGANLNTQDKWKQTALHDAVEKNHLDIVKVLIRNGADKNLRDSSWNTPLDRAKLKGYTSIAEYLSSI